MAFHEPRSPIEVEVAMDMLCAAICVFQAGVSDLCKLTSLDILSGALKRVTIPSPSLSWEYEMMVAIIDCELEDCRVGLHLQEPVAFFHRLSNLIMRAYMPPSLRALVGHGQ